MIGKKVLITGGAGFLGHNIVRGLAASGYKVVVIDNFTFGEKSGTGETESIKWVHGDVQDEAAMCAAARGCDWIFHYAGVIGGDMSAEIASAEVIAKAAIDAGCNKIVYASSCAVYGREAMDTSITEDHPLGLLSEYASVKRINELFFLSLFDKHGVASVMLRYFNPYGPRQDDRMVIPRFIGRALKGESITVYGSGAQLRDFVYIDDAVRATIDVAENVQEAEIVNIASGKETSIAELVSQIIDITGSASRLEFAPPPEHRSVIEVDRRVGSTDKLERITGFVPSTDLREGLQRTIRALTSSVPVPSVYTEGPERDRIKKDSGSRK